MRVMSVFLLCAGCMATVREVQTVRAEAAFVAGRIVTQGSEVHRTLRLETDHGEPVHVALEHDTWVVELPPGAYAVRRIGQYAPKRPVRFTARAGETRYLGTMRFGRLKDAHIDMRVADERADVERTLRVRHPGLPPFTAAAAGGDLVLRSTAEAYDPSHYRNGFYFSRSRVGRRSGR